MKKYRVSIGYEGVFDWVENEEIPLIDLAKKIYEDHNEEYDEDEVFNVVIKPEGEKHWNVFTCGCEWKMLIKAKAHTGDEAEELIKEYFQTDTPNDIP